MSGLATASPEPSRSRSSLETVGWASRKRWLGVGSPKSSIRPDTTRCRTRPSRRCIPSGSHGIVRTTWSTGRPKTYFGSTHAPLRVERRTRSATPLRDSSETMSTPLLPIPTTTTRLPTKVERIGGVDVVVRVQGLAVE